jgi:ankyrin repeat protein
LPATLDGTYARTLEDIGDQNWERARRLFQCVSVAARPLHVEELTDILAFDFDVGSTPRYQAGRRSEDPVHTVLSTCFSLLAVVDVDGSQVVQFAHFSVKEYLTSERLAKTTENISRFHVSMTPAHTIIAQACLGVLLFLDKNITKDRLKDFPLVEYAAEYWPAHARFNDVSSNILDEMKRLFDPRKHHLSAWLWLYNPICPEDPFERPETDRPNKPGLTPLYYAAACGLCDVGTFLIVERWQDLCSQAVNFDATPLHLASEFGHAGFAQLLLGRYPDSMNAMDDSYFTPLCRASYEGHAEVIQVLVKGRADKETNRNDFHLTPLQLALHKGHVEAARVLLSHKADTEVRDGGSTPLQLASKSGQLAVVRMLLEHGASTEARDDRGFTPLHLASESGELEVSRILIEHGAGLETRTPSGCTPIHLANEEIARLLIERGADVKALDDGGRTPLHHASERGCIGAARVLLENGVYAGALDADYATPLDLVPPSTNSWDRKDLVELLLEYSPSGSCTGKRRSDSPGESDSGKRLRLDAVDVEERPARRGSEDADVLMVEDS